ncbi:MAG: ABC transporter permease subunit [Verrucomicrobiota bacterium]|jgi:ABC-2 type transport system permease protein|nr:ABC transporter permease subunit [Verrucomicrobiota bacterium]MDI9384729.1 ABC transporter permease subunit [Verrucomicrobiota bacterium]
MLLLQLQNELWKLFGKKRTYIGFLIFLLAQNTIILIFRFAPAPQARLTTMLEGNGHAAGEYLSSLTFASFMVFPIAYMLLPLFAALVGGDIVAKEAEDGTLRMILSRPISRLRLILIKWLAGMVFSLLLVIALGAFGILFSSFWFPWGGMFVFVPGEMFSLFPAGEGLRAYAAAHLMMGIKAGTITGLALMFSSFNIKPAAATILAISFVFGNFIVMNIPFFEDLQHWFLTYHLNIWRLMFLPKIPWTDLWESLSLLAGFNLTFLVIAAATFQVRDIKS